MTWQIAFVVRVRIAENDDFKSSRESPACRSASDGHKQRQTASGPFWLNLIDRLPTPARVDRPPRGPREMCWKPLFSHIIHWPKSCAAHRDIHPCSLARSNRKVLWCSHNVVTTLQINWLKCQKTLSRGVYIYSLIACSATWCMRIDGRPVLYINRDICGRRELERRDALLRALLFHFSVLIHLWDRWPCQIMIFRPGNKVSGCLEIFCCCTV